MVIDLNRILVTGSGGMLGSYVNFGLKTASETLDVTDFKKIQLFCRKEKPTAILHLAAQTDLELCEKDFGGAYMVNSVGAYHLARVAKELGIKLIYISTVGIFDGEKVTPYTENDEGNPQNYYGHSKYLGELAVRSMLDDYLILRLSWVFGGGPTKDKKFVSKIIKQLGKSEISVADDVFGSPTYAKDIILVLKKLLNEDAKGIVNIANTGVCSRYDCALKISSIYRSNVKIIPVKSEFFKSNLPLIKNQSLSPDHVLTRPWKEALSEYIELEWRSVAKCKR